LELEKGEEVEWVVEDKHRLTVRRRGGGPRPSGRAKS
jgi:hypothetical protein